MGTLGAIRVILREQLLAGPLCAVRLIKIERAEKDGACSDDHVAHGESAHFAWLDRATRVPVRGSSGATIRAGLA